MKISMQFRGREIVHRNLGKKVFDRITDDFSEIANVEQHVKMEGNRMIMIMAPK